MVTSAPSKLISRARIPLSSRFTTSLTRSMRCFMLPFHSYQRILAFAFCRRNGHVFNFGIEADDNRARRAREQDVRLRNRADAGVNHFEIDFFAFDLF